MPGSEFEVVIIGGGAAGIAAGRTLHDAGIDCVIVEARDRLGGRAWTIKTDGGSPIDLGCGWLHSADRNPWCGIAEKQGRTLDKTPPPWMRPGPPIGFPAGDQQAFRTALRGFYDRLGGIGESQPDLPASASLETGSPWNGLIGAVMTYVSGTEPERLSMRDFSRYDDSGVNWRVPDGYGTTVAAHAAGAPVRLGSAVQSIDRSGKRLRIETGIGALAAKAAIVTLPTDLIAAEGIRFVPALPEKIEAAAGLPLGLADKLFLSLEGADEFEPDTRLFGRTDRTATGAYHFRPFGHAQIECYFGGALAAELEKGGESAFHDFAAAELTGLLGSRFAGRIRPIGSHFWRADPFARGSYSYAPPGQADCRSVLAAAVEDRIFFAGEACSPSDYSTAHGAYLTGVLAAGQAAAALRAKR